MEKFNQEKFDKFVIENNVIGFFKEPVVLKSGREANDYVNWRNVSSDLFLTDKLTDFLINFVEDLNLDPDSFLGVPEGATKLGILTQYKWAKKSSDYGILSHNLPMLRKKPKDHGAPKDKFFVGAPEGKIIIIEDVTTTGGSLLKAIESLGSIDVEIIAAIALTNRKEFTNDGKKVEEIIKNKSIPYFAMSSLPSLINTAYQKLKPGKEVGEKIEKYYEKYGIEKVKLL